MGMRIVVGSVLAGVRVRVRVRVRVWLREARTVEAIDGTAVARLG